MADRLSKVYGTEMDKVNCPFSIKLEHADTVIVAREFIINLQSQKHNNSIQTALISGNQVRREDAQAAMQKVQKFFEDIFNQMSQFGEIQDMIIVDNLGDHIAGNVYVKYTEQQYAENAFAKVSGRVYQGKTIKAVFSPVTDFLNAKCKQYMDGSCKRGGYCNYMHIKPLSKSFKRELFQKMYLQHPQYKIKKPESQSEDNDWKGRDRRRRDSRDRRDKKQYRGHRDQRDGRRKSRSRSRDRKNRDNRDKEKDRRRKRSGSSDSNNSTERRNMIDKWNTENY